MLGLAWGQRSNFLREGAPWGLHLAHVSPALLFSVGRTTKIKTKQNKIKKPLYNCILV